MEQHWPYPDLALRTPHCPLCGAPAQLLVGPGLHPQAFCTDAGCEALTWDPTVNAAELLAGARPVDWESSPLMAVEGEEG